MLEDEKLGIIIDEDFATLNVPPFPRTSFYAHEHPIRIKSILDYFDKVNLFNEPRIIQKKPIHIDESTIKLAHSQYHIDTVRRLSKFGYGLMSDEVFITEDTFYLAQKAIGGAIQAIQCVLNGDVSQSLALIRPPGHHALREKASGLCIFNNIATSILYFRKKLNYNKRIAIIDIDDHFGDGVAQYFYDDPDILYFSIHEFDFEEGDIGFIDELGEGNGLGKNINFPVPKGITDIDFLEFTDILEPILIEYDPDLIIVAIGFDMYWDDKIGNCFLTSYSYYNFTKWVLRMAQKLCQGKIAFILEGGYSPIGLPVCVHSVIKALLNEDYERPEFEYIDFSSESKGEEIAKIKEVLLNELVKYWSI
ncbi:MAG: histone deacetylase [Promethearchaeota archaeon]